MPFSTTTKRTVKSGKRVKGTYLNRRQATEKARYLLDTNRLSDHALDMIGLLATGGVMTDAQLDRLLPIAKRTKQKYQSDELKLIRWHYIPRNMPYVFPAKERAHVWSLAEVGCAVARIKGWSADSFDGHNQNHAVHDLLRNETITKLVTAVQDKYVVDWVGAWESRLHDSNGDVRIEPDSMIRMTQGDETNVYAVEYHNEDDRRRVGDKVERYENGQRSNEWVWQWKCQTFPTILINYTHPIVAKGYMDVLRALGRDQIRCRYLAKSMRNVLDENKHTTVWLDVNRAAFHDEMVAVDIWSYQPKPMEKPKPVSTNQNGWTLPDELPDWVKGK